jgi:glutathione S-transferase
VTSSEIILHHYPQSPVSEKVRIIFGIKDLSWRSVIIPRLPPRPNQLPLTGGYRLTPIMQIGADVYCDTQCIIRELERRYPEPTLFPGGAHGMAWGVAQWTDGPLFKDVVTMALNYMIDTMPPAFINDRGPLYFGPDFTVEALKAGNLESQVAVRAQFGWMNERLSSRDFMLGDKPGLPDALCYYLVWFLIDRMPDGDPFFEQFSNLCAWENRMRAFGNGTSTDLLDTDALEIAKQSTPIASTFVDPGDPMGFAAGDSVSVQPASGGPEVTGKIAALVADTVTISREAPEVGTVNVHFPRIGYRIKKRKI